MCVYRYTTTRVASVPIARDSKCRPNFSDNGESDEVKWKIFEDRRRRASMPKSCMTSRAPRMYRNVGTSVCDPNLGTRLTHLFRPSPSSSSLARLPYDGLYRTPPAARSIVLHASSLSLSRARDETGNMTKCFHLGKFASFVCRKCHSRVFAAVSCRVLLPRHLEEMERSTTRQCEAE